MPAPQFHLTFAELVKDTPGVPTAMRRACANEPVYTRLGGIFHDLPYYRPEPFAMVVETVRYALEAAALDEPWGYRVHSVRPAHFVASTLRAAATTPGFSTDERLALAGGLISHCALDLALHPLVNYCARRDVAAFGGHESVHHRATEKYHALFFHLDRFGEDPIGTPAFARKTQVVKAGSWLRARVEAPVAAFMQGAFRGAYGDAPSVQTWAGWVRSFRHFGLFVSGPHAAENSRRKRRDPSLRPRYFENEVFRFYEFYAHAERKLATLATLATDFMASREFAADAFARASGIDDLAEPSGVGLPTLPRLTVRCPPGGSVPREISERAQRASDVSVARRARGSTLREAKRSA